jgi:hypothetical protein
MNAARMTERLATSYIPINSSSIQVVTSRLFDGYQITESISGCSPPTSISFFLKTIHALSQNYLEIFYKFSKKSGQNRKTTKYIKVQKI